MRERSYSKSIIIFMVIMMVALFSQAVNAQTTVTTETTTEKLTQEQKVAYLSGNLNAYVPGFRSEDGSFRTCPYLSITIGADYRPEDGEFAPRVSGAVGVETRRLLWEGSVEGTVKQFPETAEQPNRHYTSMSIMLGSGWKFWQNHSHSHSNYMAVVGAVGYNHQRSDRENASLRSIGYGFSYRGALRGKLAVSRRCGLSMEAGWQHYPYQLHPESGENLRQEASYGGIYLDLGFQVYLGRLR